VVDEHDIAVIWASELVLPPTILRHTIQLVVEHQRPAAARHRADRGDVLRPPTWAWVVRPQGLVEFHEETERGVH